MENEFEVRQFLHMNVMQKSRLKEKDPQRYAELYEAANKMFPQEDMDASMSVGDK